MIHHFKGSSSHYAGIAKEELWHIYAKSAVTHHWYLSEKRYQVYKNLRST